MSLNSMRTPEAPTIEVAFDNIAGHVSPERMGSGGTSISRRSLLQAIGALTGATILGVPSNPAEAMNIKDPESLKILNGYLEEFLKSHESLRRYDISIVPPQNSVDSRGDSEVGVSIGGAVQNITGLGHMFSRFDSDEFRIEFMSALTRHLNERLAHSTLEPDVKHTISEPKLEISSDAQVLMTKWNIVLADGAINLRAAPGVGQSPRGISIRYKDGKTARLNITVQEDKLFLETLNLKKDGYSYSRLYIFQDPLSGTLVYKDAK